MEKWKGDHGAADAPVAGFGELGFLPVRHLVGILSYCRENVLFPKGGY